MCFGFFLSGFATFTLIILPYAAIASIEPDRTSENRSSRRRCRGLVNFRSGQSTFQGLYEGRAPISCYGLCVGLRSSSELSTDCGWSAATSPHNDCNSGDEYANSIAPYLQRICGTDIAVYLQPPLVYMLLFLFPSLSWGQAKGGEDAECRA